MNLKEINQELEKVLKALKEVLPKASELNYKFELRKAEIFMQEDAKGFANQALREAYVLKVLDQEGLVKGIEETKLEIKLLYISKEVLIEMSRNLREMEKKDYE